MSKKKKMRLGRVCVNTGYVVDLDNPDMIEHAMDCLVEDLCNMAKYDEFNANIDIVEDKTATKNDIPEFLLEEHKDWIE